MTIRRTRSAEQRAIIDKLHRLCGKLGKERRYRVEFVCLALIHVTHYTLWDEGWEGLGERQWDTCFEMGDSELVIADVVERARRENFLDAVRDYCTAPGAFERWLSYADRQACLF
jgi:hypothetical protein